MTNAHLKKLMKFTKNAVHASVASEDETKTTFVNTGIPYLNAMTSGSFHKGIPSKITVIAGENSTGKTFILYETIARFQKDNEEGLVVFFDTESDRDVERMEQHGIDTDRVLTIGVQTVEDFREITFNILNELDENSVPYLFTLDSLGGLSTKNEIEQIKAGDGKVDMTKAKLLRSAMRVLTLPLGKLGIPMIMTNHVGVSIGSYGNPMVMGGGEGPKFHASTIIYLTKKKDKDGKEVIGNIVTARLEKGRYARPYQRIELQLNYSGGINKNSGLIDLAIESGIWKKNQAWIEVLGHEKKLQRKYIESHPNEFFTQEFFDQLEPFANKKFGYGNPFEEEIEESEEESDD